MKKLMKKIRSSAGETLSETLVAILIIALASAAFATAITSTLKLNIQARDVDAASRAAFNSAEAGPWDAEGSVSLDGTEIKVYFNDDSEPASYRLK